MYENISSPLRYYLDRGKQNHENNVNEYFRLLKEEAKVDEASNAKTAENYRKTKGEIDLQEGKIKGLRAGRGWGIAGIIIAGLALIITFFCIGLAVPLAAFLACVVLAAAITGIVLLCKKLGKQIGDLQLIVDNLQKKANGFYQEAMEQVAPLIRLFTDMDGVNLVQKTFPHLSFDTCLTQARLDDIAAYGYAQTQSKDECVIDALSGELYGNPLLIERTLSHQEGTKTYHGSLTISWSESYTDSQGNHRTRTRTQTLHASVTKFCPYYYTNSRLHYGHDERPDLHFSRQGKHAEDQSEAALARTIRAGEKKLQRKQAKAAKAGTDFTALANTQFEVLFGATDRSDELAYRYLFTPRAQESMLELILSDDTYGDDFDFYKRGKLNTIVSDHSQAGSIFPTVREYLSYDYQEIERLFKERNYEFFKGLFFDLAPLLAIPAYQQPLVRSERIKDGQLSERAYQIMARQLRDHTAPDDADTSVIYRTQFSGVKEAADIVSVNAFGYQTKRWTDYVPVYGGDGNMHSVPVDWVEYIPIEKNTQIKVWRKTSEAQGQASYQGLAAAAVEE